MEINALTKTPHRKKKKKRNENKLPAWEVAERNSEIQISATRAFFHTDVTTNFFASKSFHASDYLK